MMIMSYNTDTVSKMTPPSDRHARRREATRRKLIDATKVLIGREGVDNIRIQEITDEADVGFGSFYNHFPGKEAIVEAVLAETIGAQGAEIDALTSDLDDPAATLLPEGLRTAWQSALTQARREALGGRLDLAAQHLGTLQIGRAHV